MHPDESTRDIDLRTLVDTVDVLRLLTLRGRRELREFTTYMVVFGLYPAVNIAAHLGLGRAFWLESLLVAFWVVTLPVAGVVLPSVVWAAVVGLTYGTYVGTQSGIATLLVLVAGIFGGMSLLYGYAHWKGRYRPARPWRLSVAPKVGWAWGVVMGGMGLLQGVLERHHGLTGADSVVLWGYAMGVGLFISGIMAPGFFYLGLLGIFGVPLLSLWTVRGAYGLHGLMGLLMALYALWLRRGTAEAAESELGFTN